MLGIFTIDPLGVVQVLDRIIKDDLDAEWVEVSFPRVDRCWGDAELSAVRSIPSRAGAIRIKPAGQSMSTP